MIREVVKLFVLRLYLYMVGLVCVKVDSGVCVLSMLILKRLVVRNMGFSVGEWNMCMLIRGFW